MQGAHQAERLLLLETGKYLQYSEWLVTLAVMASYKSETAEKVLNCYAIF